MKNLLMVVAKYPREGYVKTRLGQQIGYKIAKDIYLSLLSDLIDNMSKSNGNYHIKIISNTLEDNIGLSRLFPKTQILLVFGDDLRGKNSILADAFLKAFAEYKKVILVYSDVPFISTEEINQAFDFLNKKNVVVGSCINGGYYLIGMNKYYDLFTFHQKGRYPYFELTLDHLKVNNINYELISSNKIDLDTLDDMANIDWNRNNWIRTKNTIKHYKLI